MIDPARLTKEQMEAYKLALYEDVNYTYAQYIQKLQKEQVQEFVDGLGGYHATKAEKQAFEQKLGSYLNYVIGAHDYFVKKGIEKTRGGLKFTKQQEVTDFFRWIENAGNANVKLNDFRQQIKTKALNELNAQFAQTQENARKTKGRLKTMGAILAAGVVGTAAVFGTKAVMEKFQNSEDDDAKTDRIEHRVNIPKTTVQQRGYVQDAYEEVVIQDEVRHQTEEFRQPQKVIETVVVEKEVPVPVPVPQPTIEHQVEANTVAYQTAMTPAPTTYVQPAPTVIHQPDPVVIPTQSIIQQPTTTIIDNGPDIIGDVVGGVVGGVVAHALDHHHHHSHIGHGGRMGHPPVRGIGHARPRGHRTGPGMRAPHPGKRPNMGCGPVRAPRPTIGHGRSPHRGNINVGCRPTGSRPGIGGRPTTSGRGQNGVFFRPQTRNPGFGGKIQRQPTVRTQRTSSMRGTMQRGSNRGIRGGVGGRGGFSGNRGAGRSGGGRGGNRGGRR